MSDQNESCEGRIDNELVDTEDWLRRAYEEIDRANEAGDFIAEESLREEITPHSVDVTYVMKLELSGGGPASWLEVGLDRNRWGFEAVSVSYHFADWFDHAEREVSKQRAPGLWRLAEYYAELADGLICSDR